MPGNMPFRRSEGTKKVAGNLAPTFDDEPPKRASRACRTPRTHVREQAILAVDVEGVSLRKIGGARFNTWGQTQARSDPHPSPGASRTPTPGGAATTLAPPSEFPCTLLECTDEVASITTYWAELGRMPAHPGFTYTNGM